MPMILHNTLVDSEIKFISYDLFYLFLKII